MLRLILLLLAAPLGAQTIQLPPIGESAPDPSPRAAVTEVDLELLLLVDVSRSMTAEEHAVQRRGYAAALASPAVAAAMRRGLTGRIALAYVEWAGAESQRIIVDWTLIEGPEETEAFAATLLARPAYSIRYTSITAALRFGARYFDGNGFEGLRRVIDISGDGPNNQGGLVTLARDEALARGITINGLPIMAFTDAFDRWSIPDLDAYYAACVIGGPGAFVIAVEDWEDMAEAIERKLVLEIAGTATLRPIPAQGYDCLIGEKIWDANRRPFAAPQE